MGMYYAALNVSTPAFQQFLGCYQSIDGRSFDLGSHSWIIEALSEAISSALLRDPTWIPDSFSETSQPTLNDIVHEVEIKNRPAWTTYLHLLSTLRSRQTLLKSWVEFLDTFSFTNQTHCHLAYSVIVSLIRSGQSGKAAKYLEEVSQRCGDNLPFISSLPSLRVLVDDPIIAETLPSLVQGTDYELLLETCLGNIEQRLGIQWQDVPSSPNKGQAHISVTAGSQWMVFDEQPLLTIDGDCAGYDDPSRLYPEIQARGCSKSRKDLHQIVDLLNEYDGTAQPVTVKLDHSRIGLSPSISLHEFQWCPQHSPLEFSDSPLSLLADDRHAGRTSTALGLLRARAMANGVPQDEHRSLHLMQLGTLSMRDGPGEKWLPSGYIVAWDRRLGEMIALYVGKSHGVIDNGPTPPNPPFGAVLDIRSTMMPNAQQWGADQRSRSLANSYYLDIDPSPDLEHLDPR
ncbi:hypothetical protein N7462_002644 [Penicillium macrosclerotiorum]|uniref:uncharacterized protein n=1 Tax=Penicillium macrosclerotiorum TaxID=303699 RepID=UPI00254825CB|nr:uncharacterized protein N7462_002644 [Penicillium macrosclerotiorum]KAJ5693221.1 hypothetical protein N7462_002644 [Penicillium macrosclerotiorum]